MYKTSFKWLFIDYLNDTWEIFMKIKKIGKITILGLAATLMSATQAIELPTIKSEGQTLESFIPDGWKLMENGSVKGDLNNDGIDDIAAIFEAKEAMPMSSTEGENTNSEATAVKPRILTVLFANKDGGYKLSTQANHGILRSDEGSVMGDPIAYMKIRRNALNVGYVGGDADKNHWEVVARFRYKNNDWYMTGYNKSNYITATSQVIKNDFNAMTGKMRITTKNLNVNPEDDKIKQMTRWEQVEKNESIKLSSFDPWTVIRVGGATTTADR